MKMTPEQQRNAALYAATHDRLGSTIIERKTGKKKIYFDKRTKRPSINAAKRASRKLQAEGFTVAKA